MAQEFSKLKFSASTSGRGIKIAQTATPGDLLHASHATDLDELWAWVVNSSATPVKITFEYGGVASPDDHIEVTIPAESGLLLVVPGLLLTGGLNLRAFAATTNVLIVYGYVNRITTLS